LAKKYNALVIYAEHRFFGESIPKGNVSREYIRTENTLSDYANLIGMLKKNNPRSAVITFGGSYGGMMATWMRMKFPDLV
jgi:lysosomal Pro-X carboxypeptidase